LWRWILNDPFSTVAMNTLSTFGVSLFAYSTPLLATTTTFNFSQELKRARKYTLHIALGSKTRLGRAGKAIEYRIDEFSWKQRFQRLFDNLLSQDRPVTAMPGSGILLLTGNLGPGGSERQVVNTALGLRQCSGETITIACLSLKS